nr:AEC family transporter [Pirellula sp.]
MAEDVSRINELRRTLTAVEPSAFLVEERVVRRVIRDRHGLANLALELPHTESQVVSADDIRRLTHPDELGLTTFTDLPNPCLLICEPHKGQLDHWPLQELKLKVWRQLFHARLDRELRNHFPPENRELLRSNIAAIGQVEFDEAHYVLRSEHRLMSPHARDEVWRELVAIYCELRCFEPDLLPTWFPSLQRLPQADRILSQGIDVDQIFRETRLEGALIPELKSHSESDEDRLKSTRRSWSMGIGVSQSDRSYLSLLRSRDRSNERGNTVYAITCAIRASQCATSETKRDSAEAKAREDVSRLVDRLREAIAFAKQDTDNWQAALWALAENSVHGFWNKEKRLLYDLQKVCLDHERLTYKVDLVKWLVSRGKRPIRYPLRSVREVAMAKHLASAASRLSLVRLSGSERDRLTELIEHAAHLSESQMRERMRPVIKQSLHNVNLLPKSIPEHVAFDKVVEESIDCIVERGYLTMGYLRDVVSKNDLKLPDLKDVREVWHGDQLLRVDEQLDLALDGVYRRGDFYLRWLQVVSSLFFGTRLGRFATLYLIIPFGGAVVIVEGAMHVIHMFQKGSKTQRADNESDTDLTSSPQSDPDSIASDSSGSLSNKGEPIVMTGSLQADDDAEQRESDPTGSNLNSEEATSIVSVSPKTTDQAVNQILTRQTDTLWLVLLLGFLLMALIHVPSFRKLSFGLLVSSWKLAKRFLFEVPLQLFKLPIFMSLWEALPLVYFSGFVLVPGVLSFVLGRWLPILFGGKPLDWIWVGVLFIGSSLLVNSRLGRDVQELTRDWIVQSVHQVQSRLVFALIGWVVDFFRLLLNVLERVLYAVDEWLRFHSDESAISIVFKAILGVIWSFVSFLIRIYVNLLIEPTFHPVKHFPVVTVAHKIFLPALIMLEGHMVNFLGQYMGTPLARSITWFNIFFLPGFFGFAVWELKENWRLYLANRRDRLLPVPVGSHGETIARLLRPGLHSGTLPKLFRKLRKLEHQSASLGRFTSRRAIREKLHHVESAIQAFVERELISLLEKCPVWQTFPVKCSHVEAFSNSFVVEFECPKLGASVLQIRVQEQSGWIVACISQIGWLKSASDEQWNSFCNAVEGFYRKSGIELVREQIERAFTKRYPYDVDSVGLLVWPSKSFDIEIVTDLMAEGDLRPMPEAQAAEAGLQPTPRERVIFESTSTTWSDWETLWSERDGISQ